MFHHRAIYIECIDGIATAHRTTIIIFLVFSFPSSSCHWELLIFPSLRSINWFLIGTSDVDRTESNEKWSVRSLARLLTEKRKFSICFSPQYRWCQWCVFDEHCSEKNVYHVMKLVAVKCEPTTIGCRLFFLWHFSWYSIKIFISSLSLPSCTPSSHRCQYFRTLNTRVSVVYVETWGGANQAQIDGSKDISKAISNFNDYTSRNLFKIDKDTTQLLT